MNRIAVDLGGTKIEAMITGENPLSVIKKKRIPTERDKGYDHILDRIVSLIAEMKNDAADPEEVTVGICMPGSLHPVTGMVRNSNTTVFNNRTFKLDIERKVGHTVHTANDANCFALSETIFGIAKNYKTVCGIIMGTGMGGGIIQDKKILTGANGNGGEFGHTTIEPFGPKCWCGRRGCVELFISGTGLQDIYKSNSGRQETVQEIYKLYLSGEFDAVKTMDAFLNYFAISFNNFFHWFHPDAFVFGGGVSNLPILYDEGYKRFLELANIQENTVRFLKNDLGDSSGIFGASILSEL